MANAKHDYLRNAVINAVLRNVSYTSPATVYAALYTTAPTNSTSGTEVGAGVGYARQAVTFAAPSPAGATQNSAPVTFGPNTTTDWGTVVGTAVLDASVAGNILYFGALAASKNVQVGDSVSFAAGALTVTET